MDGISTWKFVKRIGKKSSKSGNHITKIQPNSNAIKAADAAMKTPQPVTSGSNKDTNCNDDATTSGKNVSAAAEASSSATTTPKENFGKAEPTSSATPQSQTFYIQDENGNYRKLDERDTVDNQSLSDEDDSDQEDENEATRSKTASVRGQHDDLIMKLHKHLSQAQRRYPSPRYTRNLEQDSLSEDDIEYTLLDFMWVHYDKVKDFDIVSRSSSGQLYNEIKTLEKQVKESISDNKKAVRDRDDYANKLSDLRSQKAKEITKLKEDIKNAKYKRDTELSNQKIKLDNKYGNMVVEKDRKYNERGVEMQRLTQRISSFEIERKETSRKHEEDMRNIVGIERTKAENYYIPQIQDLKKRLTGIEDIMNAQIQQMKEEHEGQIQSLREYHRQNIVEMKEDYNIQLSSFESKLQKAREDHKQNMLKMEKSHGRDLKAKAEEIEELKHDHLDLVEALNQSLEDLKRQNLANIKQIEKKAEEKLNEKDRQSRLVMAKAHKEHEKQMKGLKQENQDLKGALVKRTNQRDTYKQLTDRDLSSRFLDLASDIDDVSRVTWDTSKQKSWPVAARQIRNAENERKIKKNIIQNSIWTVLNDKIFQTPFRVLGGRGKSLEQKWTEKFGSGLGATTEGYSWPIPSTQSESWRRSHLLGLTEIIDSDIAEIHEKYSWKKAYERSIKEIRVALIEDMDKVTSDKTVDDMLDEIAHKAALLWIEGGIQWYRIQLHMSSYEGNLTKSGSEGKGRMQQLVVVPELRRIGNSHGEDYAKNEVVSGCNGEFEML